MKKPASTGWLDVSALLVNGWAGKAYLARRETVVMLRLHALAATSATSGGVITLPTGFRPVSIGSSTERPLLHTTAPAIRRAYFAGATLTVSAYQAADQLYGDIRFDTADAWPSSYPEVSV
ncbi:hypothetical protein ACFSDA_15325 [Brachybacterium rhamnosum]|uniref:Uncharacterized protein n=1 Tax=Brachybacterium rhamnosum TaxID=173361 RepID=A0ABW4Q1Z7_9MICO